MQRIKDLDYYQKGILIIMIVMAVIFAVMEHKGDGVAWLGATFICILNAILILFADELFQFCLSFRIRDAQYAEPSDIEIAGRYIGWTVFTAMVFMIFITGLQ